MQTWYHFWLSNRALLRPSMTARDRENSIDQSPVTWFFIPVVTSSSQAVARYVFRVLFDFIRCRRVRSIHQRQPGYAVVGRFVPASINGLQRNQLVPRFA